MALAQSCAEIYLLKAITYLWTFLYDLASAVKCMVEYNLFYLHSKTEPF